MLLGLVVIFCIVSVGSNAFSIVFLKVCDKVSPVSLFCVVRKDFVFIFLSLIEFKGCFSACVRWCGTRL